MIYIYTHWIWSRFPNDCSADKWRKFADLFEFVFVGLIPFAFCLPAQMISSSGRWQSYPQNWQYRRKGMFHSIHHFLFRKEIERYFHYLFIFEELFINAISKQYLRNGIWMTRNARAIGMENSIDMIQIKVIINFEIYLGGRALQRNECIDEMVIGISKRAINFSCSLLSSFRALHFNLAHRLFHKFQRTHWTIGSIYLGKMRDTSERTYILPQANIHVIEHVRRSTKYIECFRRAATNKCLVSLEVTFSPHHLILVSSIKRTNGRPYATFTLQMYVWMVDGAVLTVDDDIYMFCLVGWIHRLQFWHMCDLVFDSEPIDGKIPKYLILSMTHQIILITNVWCMMKREL